MNAINVLDVVDQHNLTLMKLPDTQVSLWTCTKSDLTRSLPDGFSLEEKLIKSGVSDKMWKDRYEGLVGVRFDNGDVYRTFLKMVKTTSAPRWVCFKNYDINVRTGLLINKTLYHGATPEDAVRAFLSDNE